MPTVPDEDRSDPMYDKHEGLDEDMIRKEHEDFDGIEPDEDDVEPEIQDEVDEDGVEPEIL